MNENEPMNLQDRGSPRAATADRLAERGRFADASTDPHGRSPNQIEDDIQQTRLQMDETLSALQRKLSPEGLTHQMMGYLREGGGQDFVRYFGESVKRNPMPVTLVGIGLAWLMMSGREGRFAPDKASSGTSYHIRGSGGGGRLSSAASATREKLSGAASAARGTMNRLGGAASATRESLSSAASSARGTLSGAAHRVSGAASASRERVGSAGGHLRERGADLRGRAAQMGGSARQQASRAYGSAREQPLLLAAVGIAIGAALGAMLPATRREDELLGQTRDRLADRARVQVGEQLEKGKKIAQAAGEAATEAAQDEAKRQAGSEGSTRSDAGGTRPSPSL